MWRIVPLLVCTRGGMVGIVPSWYVPGYPGGYSTPPGMVPSLPPWVYTILPLYPAGSQDAGLRHRVSVRTSWAQQGE